MTDLNTLLQAPEWQMRDAYESVDSDLFKAACERLRAGTAQLLGHGPVTPDAVLELLEVYDNAFCVASSLASFVKCLGAKDGTDEAVAQAKGQIAILNSELEVAAEPLMQTIRSLAQDDPLWQKEPLAHWRFVMNERSTHWQQQLPEAVRDSVTKFSDRCFLPLGECFTTLQKGVDFTAQNSRGETERIRAARLIAVIKGDPDRTLRQNVHAGVQQSYGARGAQYAQLLGALHGFRLSAFELAGVTPLQVSLHQNRMSAEALNALRTAILSRIDTARQCVTLRTPYFGTEKMEVFDLMAPAPVKKSSGAAPIPYAQGIATVKEALATVHPDIASFIDMMLDKGWVEASISDKKIGGAFYSRFNELRMPRVFSTYMGSITAILQQGHELGHAFHYWQMRDLPVIETEFPMTLTEMASTFNEAVIRQYLMAQGDKQARFEMLWQEMRSGANFLLNTMVRMDFEVAYFEARRQGSVNAAQCCELMRKAWHDWYGETTSEADAYLWAYKLHFYKTDQLIYNYPYSVGFLLSQALLPEMEKRGKDFYPFYLSLLRDTGRMGVDELVRVHFGADATDPAFWLQAMQGVLGSIEEFKSLNYPL